MKTIVNAFFIVIAFLLGIVDTVAKNNPPVPNPNGRVTNDGGPPTPPVPIDENLSFLFVIALLLGIYIVYNHKFKTQNQA